MFMTWFISLPLSETTESLRSIKRKLKEIKLMLTKLTVRVRQQGTLGYVWADGALNMTLGVGKCSQRFFVQVLKRL